MHTNERIHIYRSIKIYILGSIIYFWIISHEINQIQNRLKRKWWIIFICGKITTKENNPFLGEDWKG